MSAEQTARRLTVWLVAMAAGLGAIAGAASLDRRRVDLEASRAFVAATGLYEPCLSTRTRWIRHPDHVDAIDALSEGPGLVDFDPAGAWITARHRVRSGSQR